MILTAPRCQMKTSLVFALLIAAGAAMYLPTQAMAAVNLDIAVGAPPPPQRTEVVPPPRPGFAWIPGFWDWSGSTYVWLPGHWEPAREGFVYEAPVWGHSPDGWHL